MGSSQIDSIAYAFMSHYYTVLNEDPAKVGKMYELNAVLNHSDPQNPFSPTESLTGNQAISKHFENSQLKGCKVVCFTIDVQPVKDEGILICCMGELTLAEEKQCKSFTQTFLLVKAGEKIYDIGNDVLKFIPDIDGLKQKEEPKAAASEVAEAEKLEAKSDKKETVEPVEKLTEKVEMTEDIKVPEVPEEPEIETKGEPKVSEEEHKVTESKTQEPAVPEIPEPELVEHQTPQQLSWAARAAVARSEQLKKSAMENGDAKKKTPAKKSKEPVKEQVKEPTKEEKEQPVKPRKGEGAFPIYIKGIERDIEPLLVGELESHFGKVEYCKIERFVALVSFAKQEAQVKALETKQLTIKSRTIKLEPRIKRNDEKRRKNTPKQQKKPQTKKIDDDGFKKVGK